MEKIYVTVESETDSMGIETPLKIKWDDGKKYVINRVLHTIKHNTDIIEYIVLIQGKQRKLIKENQRWCVYPAKRGEK